MPAQQVVQEPTCEDARGLTTALAVIMDITEGTKQRRDLGIERFLAGDPLIFEGVSFWKHNKGHLVVASYSDFADPEQILLEEAERKIARSKVVLERLAELEPEFGCIASALEKEYEFCLDYHTGACLVARLEGNRVVWVLGK